MQHTGAAGGRPEDDDDHGPPDWFAAVAEPGPGPDRAPGRVPGRSPSGRRPAASGPADVGDLGLVTASELPTGRRRRRSALEQENTDPGTGGGRAGADGHGGVAAPARSLPPSAGRSSTGRSSAGQSSAGRRGRGRAGRPEHGEAPETGASRRTRTEEPADPEARARDICLRLLTGAAKTRKQLADALRKREIPDEVAEEVLTRLEEVGLIDDAAFARAWVESRHAVRGLSRRALAQELRTRGVTGEQAEQALAQLDHDDEAEAARELVDRRLRTTRGLERQARTRRLVGVLARRGYSEGLAFRVVREALDEEEPADAGADADGPSGEDWD
ncbi:regulatory protein RecX [Kitasatospora sp. NBC_00458]|uniref:regulatory protein RecX n=1 Tax=Kitasatospora sp. NBC_00458 TaxID=2903568 RepID=UPI002E1855DE